MKGHADIIALWIKTLRDVEGKVPAREFRAMKIMVDATLDALEAAGVDMDKLRGEVSDLVRVA